MASLLPIVTALHGMQSGNGETNVQLDTQGCNITCCSTGVTQTNRNRRIVYYPTSTGGQLVPEKKRNLIGRLFSCCCCCCKGKTPQQENLETRKQFFHHLKSSSCPTTAFVAIKKFCDTNDLSWKEWCNLDNDLREQELRQIQVNAEAINQEILNSDFYQSLLAAGVNAKTAHAMVVDFLSKSPRGTPINSRSPQRSRDEVSRNNEDQGPEFDQDFSEFVEGQEDDPISFREVIKESYHTPVERREEEEKVPSLTLPPFITNSKERQKEERRPSSSNRSKMVTSHKLTPSKELNLQNDPELLLDSIKEKEEVVLQITLPKSLDGLWPKEGTEVSDELCIALYDAIKKRQAKAKLEHRKSGDTKEKVTQIKEEPVKDPEKASLDA